MNKKTAVLATVVLFVVAASVASCTMPFGRPASVRIEAPEGWEKVEEQSQEGSTVVAYRSSGTAEAAVGAFGTRLEEAGWQPVQPASQDSGTPPLFEKGNLQAEIFVIGDSAALTAYVLVSPKHSEEAEQPPVPSQNVGGQDIEGLPRYPGAVMTRYEASPDALLLEYIVQGDTPAVLRHYTSQLQANGWALQSFGGDGTLSEIAAVKKGVGLVTVRIQPGAEPDGSTRVVIELAAALGEQ